MKSELRTNYKVPTLALDQRFLNVLAALLDTNLITMIINLTCV